MTTLSATTGSKVVAPSGAQAFLSEDPMPKTARGLHYEVTDLRPAWQRDRRGGRPVVFHHGVGARLEIFDAWMPIIAARHPVARFDMRGFGRSVVPPQAHEWTMDELIADLLEVSETAFGTGPVHVMGESIGGTIALAAGLGHPARFTSVAMSNAAIKGGHIGYAPGWRAELARVGIEGWSKRLMEMRFVPGAVPEEAIAWFGEVQAKSHPHVVVGLGELLIGTDLTSELRHLQVALAADDAGSQPLRLALRKPPRWQSWCRRWRSRCSPGRGTVCRCRTPPRRPGRCSPSCSASRAAAWLRPGPGCQTAVERRRRVCGPIGHAVVRTRRSCRASGGVVTSWEQRGNKRKRRP